MQRNRSQFPLSKRLIDIVICSLGLIVLSPIMLLAALIVRLTSPGPILYRAKRAGYLGRPFTLLKFRTMHVGSDKFGPHSRRDDPRVFAVGRYLRLFKIDELPQIFNVLKGEMSVVGPRPEDLETVRKYYTSEQLRVLDVPPGLICFPEVRFYPDFGNIDPGGMDPQEHYAKVILPMRLDMDLEYVRRRTFWLDTYMIATIAYLIAVKTWFILLFGQKTRTLKPRGFTFDGENINP